MQVYYPFSIEIYNKAFFGVTKKDLGEDRPLNACKTYENIYSKKDLVALVQKSKVHCPELEFKY
jgi:hypothetical protein